METSRTNAQYKRNDRYNFLYEIEWILSVLWIFFVRRTGQIRQIQPYGNQALTADSALPLLWLCVVWNCSGELEIRLALYSTLVSPTSAIECGLNFSRSGSIWLLRVFLRVLQFSSLSKIDSSQMHLSGVLCSGIMHDRLAAPIGAPFICIRPILLSCPFVIQLLGVQVRVISRHYYYYCCYYYYYYYYVISFLICKYRVLSCVSSLKNSIFSTF